MASTTDYKEWIETNVDTEDNDELYALHQAVETLSGEAGFDIQPKDNPEAAQHFLKSPADVSTLVIASEKMRLAILEHIRTKYMDDMEPDSFLSFHQQLDEDN